MDNQLEMSASALFRVIGTAVAYGTAILILLLISCMSWATTGRKVLCLLELADSILVASGEKNKPGSGACFSGQAL